MANLKKKSGASRVTANRLGPTLRFPPSPISFIYPFQYFVQSNIRPAALIILLHPSANLPSRFSEFNSLHLSLPVSGVRLERCQPFHPTLFLPNRTFLFLVLFPAHGHYFTNSAHLFRYDATAVRSVRLRRGLDIVCYSILCLTLPCGFL